MVWTPALASAIVLVATGKDVDNAGSYIARCASITHVCSAGACHVVVSVVIKSFFISRSFHVLFLLGVCCEVGNIQNLLNVIINHSNVGVFPNNDSYFGIGRHTIV